MKFKKALIAGLLAFVSFFIDFTSFNSIAYAKIGNIDNKLLVEEIENSITETNEAILEEEQKEQEELERKQREAEEAQFVQTSVAEETYSYTPSVTYGTYGRLYVSGFDVALYDYNVYTNSSLSLQQIVDNWDSAAYYASRNRLVIADHNTHGFSVLYYLSEGTTAYIQFEDGSTISYRLIKRAKGYNTGPDLVDTENNSFFNMDSDIIMYTCYEDGIMVTLWVLA